MSGVDPDRRVALNATKLRALVAAQDGRFEPTGAGAFGRGASMHDGERAWVLADDRPERALGPALAWAFRHGLNELHLLVDGPETAEELARRAAMFNFAITVWAVKGRSLARARPGPVPRELPPSPAALELASVLTDAGADLAIEHGVVTGEVLGLELARVVEDGRGPARIEVGVGRHDREAFAIVHGDLPAADALTGVIDAVRSHRRPGADPHPLNELVPERWLLADLLSGRRPELAGFELRRCAGTVVRQSVKDVLPAVAKGIDAAGSQVSVSVSTGVDLDAVPLAADARSQLDADADLILVVPERDVHPMTRRLAATLTAPATIVTVPDDWREQART